MLKTIYWCLQDCIDGQQQAIPDGQAFLYIRPAHGGKGK
jgi:hypothetical protein